MSIRQSVNTAFAPAERKAQTVSSLWSRTEAVKADENFITLRICSTNRPASLMDGDGWLAFISRSGSASWDVGIWRGQMDNPRLFDDKDRAALDAIRAELRSAGTKDGWASVAKTRSPDGPSLSR